MPFYNSWQIWALSWNPRPAYSGEIFVVSHSPGICCSIGLNPTVSTCSWVIHKVVLGFEHMVRVFNRFCRPSFEEKAIAKAQALSQKGFHDNAVSVWEPCHPRKHTNWTSGNFKIWKTLEQFSSSWINLLFILCTVCTQDFFLFLSALCWWFNSGTNYFLVYCRCITGLKVYNIFWNTLLGIFFLVGWKSL